MALHEQSVGEATSGTRRATSSTRLAAPSMSTWPVRDKK